MTFYRLRQGRASLARQYGAMADEFTGFSRNAFLFWNGLEKHNNREWFQGHKDNYEQAVRRPMQLLIEELKPMYGPGRLSRINKDMRLAKESIRTVFAIGDSRRNRGPAVS